MYRCYAVSISLLEARMNRWLSITHRFMSTAIGMMTLLRLFRFLMVIVVAGRYRCAGRFVRSVLTITGPIF